MYDVRAQEFVFSLWLKYPHWSREKLLKEIRKTYAGFGLKTLEEWIERLNWRERRAQADMKLREFEAMARDTTRVIMIDLNAQREKLKAAIESADKPDPQVMYAMNQTCKLLAEIQHKHEAQKERSRLEMDVLMVACERLLAALSEIADLAEPLKRHSAVVGRLVAEIAETHGKREAA